MFRPLLISMFLTSTALATTWTVDDCNDNGIADAEEILPSSNVRLYEITNNDQTRIYFGRSLAMADDFLIIGDPSFWKTSEPGRVHVYRRQGFDWNLEITLFPPNNIPNTEGFGTKVATDGLSILVASSYEEAVYIYHFDGTTWNLESSFTGPGDCWSFANTLAVDGDVAVVGDGEDGHDTCYVYRRVGKQWSEEAQLHSSDGQWDFAYYRLDIDGNTIAVGADDQIPFLYEYSEENGWVGSSLPDSQKYPMCDGGLTLKGDTLVCGGDSWASEPYIHVFRRESDQWFHEGIIEPSFPTGFGGNLGRIFNLSGNLLVVSTTSEFSQLLRTAFAFRMVDGEWQQVAHLALPAIYQGDSQMSGYGYTIASDRERVAISSVSDENDPVVASPVFIFDLSLDCDQDGLIDLCEIVSGEMVDADGDGVPDLCECMADISEDGYVNVSDLLAVIDQWGLTNSPADINEDGIVDVSDLLIVVGNWGPCE